MRQEKAWETRDFRSEQTHSDTCICAGRQTHKHTHTHTHTQPCEYFSLL